MLKLMILLPPPRMLKSQACTTKFETYYIFVRQDLHLDHLNFFHHLAIHVDFPSNLIQVHYLDLKKIVFLLETKPAISLPSLFQAALS